MPTYDPNNPTEAFVTGDRFAQQMAGQQAQREADLAAADLEEEFVEGVGDEDEFTKAGKAGKGGKTGGGVRLW
jgi:hypothetical protein